MKGKFKVSNNFLTKIENAKFNIEGRILAESFAKFLVCLSEE